MEGRGGMEGRGRMGNGTGNGMMPNATAATGAEKNATLVAICEAWVVGMTKGNLSETDAGEWSGRVLALFSNPKRKGQRMRLLLTRILFDSVGGCGECDFNSNFGLEFEFERR